MPNPAFNAPITEGSPVSEAPQPSHRDLYLMLGELSGQLKTVVAILSEKRAEIVELRTRVGELEKKVAVGVFLVIGISLIVPVTTTTITNRFASNIRENDIEDITDKLDVAKKRISELEESLSRKSQSVRK